MHRVAALDGRLAVWIDTHRYAPLNDVFVWLSRIGELGAVWVVLALLLSYACWRRVGAAFGFAIFTALTTLTADGLATGIKELVHRPRPSLTHPQIHTLYVVHSTSFPSAHATTAFAGAALLSWLVPRAVPLFVILASAIAFSRVYVGVHYPADVIAGAAIGAVLGILSAMLLERATRRGERRLGGLTLRPRQLAGRRG